MDIIHGKCGQRICAFYIEGSCSCKLYVEFKGKGTIRCENLIVLTN